MPEYLFPVAASVPGGSTRRISDNNVVSEDDGATGSPQSGGPIPASSHGTAALTASFSVDSTIDETDPFDLIQRGLNQQAHNDMWGAADSFGRASVMLKIRSDALLAKEAEHSKAASHRRNQSHPPGTGLAHRRSGSDSASGTFNEKGERRSVRREAAEVFKERSREYFRQARESLIAAMAIDTKASSSSESKDSPEVPDEQAVKERCVVFRRLFAPGHTKGGVPTDVGSSSKTAKDLFPDGDLSEEDLRTLARRFEELEEMAVSPQDYAPVGGDGDYHSYETSNLIDSNLEPHYSNLIDSANAPIFGVDRQGRVNVW